ITDGAGLDNRPFTIPTSLVTTILATPAAPFLAPIILLRGTLGSTVTLAYLIKVGSAYLDMSLFNKAMLVDARTDVWQGKNSYLARSYVFDSCISQCVRGSGAYGYTAGSNWYSYNAEQQASIVEDWFVSGEPTSGALWDYIRDYVRQGRD